MRQVLLAGKYYKVTDDPIISRPISPWMAKVSSGSTEYSDFSQAQLEEWHDFRNGIGLESMLPAESARLWWSEGIDFSTPRSAVLGPLVNTAEYDTWEGTHDYSLLNFVIPTATKLTGYCYECTTDAGSSGATEPTWPTTVGNTVGDGGITWTCRAYLAPIKIIDFKGTDSTKKTYIIQNSRILKWDGTNLDCVDNSLANPIDAIVVTDPTDEYLVVSSATDAIYSVDGTAWIAFPDAKCMGYLAFYDTKLRALDADGGTLHSSPANDIDGTWTEFNLTGQFGTVYDLFEGKLLADGTPTLYFCGTEGLFTIDVANSKAYKQEVEYPNLTYAGHKGMYWNANAWVATGYGILKVTPSMATFVGPDLDSGLPSRYQGNIYDMVTVNNWLIFCVNGGSSATSSILKRNSSYGGNLQVYTTSAINKPIACLHHSPSSLYPPGRLWFGEGTDVKYMMFPDITSNVKQISTYEYVEDSGYGILPTLRKLAAITKVALGIAAITKYCNDDEYINVYYTLGSTNICFPYIFPFDFQILLGSFKTSPRPTILTFNSGQGVEFYTISFSIELIRGTTATNSPELESLLFYYIARPATINAWTFNVLCIEDNAEELIAEFEAIRDTKTLVVFNPTGDELKTDFDYNVALTTMPMKFYVENQQTREGIISVTCEQVFEG